MKFGIIYSNYDTSAYLVYALQHFTLEKEDNRRIFHIKNSENTFTFIREDYQPSRSAIADCDKTLLLRLYLTHATPEEIKDKSQKIIISSNGEPPRVNGSDPTEYLKNFLDNENIYITGSQMNFQHENLIFDPFWHLVLFYYGLGFNYLNYYERTEKQNLLGVYHKSVHSSERSVTNREYVFQECKKILDADLVIYHSSDYKMKEIIEPYMYYGRWQTNHISSYTDYSTSACNLIFETYVENNVPVADCHDFSYLTEKTLKSILFGKCNIFFIWCGTNYWFKTLSENGFWFLNSEFYNYYADESESPMLASVVLAVRYLKQLKQELKTDTEVHKYLIQQYGHKLQNNIRILNTILDGSAPTSIGGIAKFLSRLKD